MKEDIEALVFLSKEIVNIKDLSTFFSISIEEINKIVDELVKDYKDRGINFVVEDGNLLIRTNPLNGETIKNYFMPELKVRKLSKSSLEVLTIVAFKGPITKTEIEEIRNTGVDHIVPVLLEKKLIKVVGKKKTLGNPNLYEVTDDFYNYLQKNAVHIRDINRNNKVITMSTCTESYTNGRIVLFGELIRRWYEANL